MRLYEIYEKSSGRLVQPIQLESLHEVGNYTFDKYEYRDVTPAANGTAPVGTASVYGGRRKLTKLEWRKLLTAREEEDFDEVVATVETMQLPEGVERKTVRTFVRRYQEATVMDLDDPDQEKGFQLLVALGKMQPHRVREVLNG